MGAKKSHKHRKHGRGKKNGKSDRQRVRTEANKVRQHNKRRARIGLPPVTPTVARTQMNNHRLVS